MKIFRNRIKVEMQEVNPELMKLAAEAREKKGAIKMKDPIQAMKMQEAMKQSMNQMTGIGQDISGYPPEVRRQILKQRIRQRQYLAGMQRANMNMREVEAEKMEERMKTAMANMPQQMAAMQAMQSQQQNQDDSDGDEEEELTPEEREKRRIRNQKKRERKKRAAVKSQNNDENE